MTRWSRLTSETIMAKYLSTAKNVTVVDYHTGLGPRGYGERIGNGKPGTPGWDLADELWGDVTSFDDGSSSSAPVTGISLEAWERGMPQAKVAAIALEFGTLPLDQVLLAVRADNWLHAHGDLNSDLGKRIKRQARDAFYQDADDWKMMVWSRGIDTHEIAVAGMSRW